MAISLNRNSGKKAEPNVTPLIDVLFVLLVIFMVIAPSTSGLSALVPQPADEKSNASPDDVVITIFGNQTVRLNQEVVALADLDRRLRALFKTAPNHVVFL